MENEVDKRLQQIGRNVIHARLSYRKRNANNRQLINSLSKVDSTSTNAVMSIVDMWMRNQSNMDITEKEFIDEVLK